MRTSTLIPVFALLSIAFSSAIPQPQPLASALDERGLPIFTTDCPKAVCGQGLADCPKNCARTCSETRPNKRGHCYDMPADSSHYESRPLPAPPARGGRHN